MSFLKQSVRNGIITLGALAAALAPSVSQARPEYAARLGYLNCTACHVSSTGGGPRTVDGKMWGGRGGNPTSWVSKQDLFSVDFRSIGLFPSNPKTAAASEVALMAVTPQANVKITDLKDGGVETHLVTGVQLGLLGFGGVVPRESYVLARLKDPSDSALVKDIVFGRFIVPYGVMTDEHRSYTRAQNRTGMYDFEMGALVSGDLLPYLHHDLGVTTGFQNGGNFVANDQTYELFANLRATLPGLPFHVGTSWSQHHSDNAAYDPFSASLYTGWSLDRLSHGLLRGALLFEYEVAHGWNDPARNSINLGKFFASSVYQAAVKDSYSAGAYGLADIVLTDKWSLFYKYDRLAFDLRYPGDAFNRHGIGAKYYFNPYMSLSGRYEISSSGRDDLNTGTANTRNDVLLYFITSI